MHWDGGAWSEVSSPYNPAINSFQAVGAVAANDVWAVGRIISVSPSTSTIFRWDGSSWSNVPAPNAGLLSGVSAASANDVWAVGVSGKLHWDGSAWTLWPGSTTGPLAGVAALSSGDVWAVGRYNDGYADRTLVEHYDDACI